MIRPGDPRSLLDAPRREIELAALRSEGATEILVVGGGITGAGIALDAAARGMAVTLVERYDLAHGTSRWSSKLVHGGLRYLASGDVGVALESARERHLLMTRIAPHLVRPLPTLIPDYGGTQPWVGLAGLIAGDGLRAAAGTSRSLLPRARRVDPRTALRMAPALRSEGLRGAMVGWDGQLEDDARLVVAVARTAAAYGARILTGVEALEVGAGRATLRDDSGEFTVEAGHIVTATGVWTPQLCPEVPLRPSRGTHLVVESSLLGKPTASVTVPVPGEFGRFVFALPQPDGVTFIGLTDVPSDSLTPDPPRADPDEISWLLEQVSAALAAPLGRGDVLTTFSGLRPLVADTHLSTADISRRHLVKRLEDGTVVVTGGKLTTYRRMAQDAVDMISGTPCTTQSIALVGAPGDSRSRDRLVRRYGAEAHLVGLLGLHDPGLAQPLGEGPATGAEVRWARIAEGAPTLQDAVEGRLRLDLRPDAVAAAEASGAWG
jgi:glycerol-3-phosphate dehydrogenase